MPGQKTIDDIEDNPSTYRDVPSLHHSANDTTYEDLLQAESMVIKERTLERIRNAQRDRAFSNLTQSACSQDSYWGGEDSDDSDDEPYHSTSVDDRIVVHNTLVNANNSHFSPSSSIESASTMQFAAPTLHPPQPPISSPKILPPNLGNFNSTNGIGKFEENDVRKELFEAIPEPYYFSTEFSRVRITDTAEPVDNDTKEACRLLKICMAIREKWIDQHPSPPQDEETFDAYSVSNHPSHANLAHSPKSPGRKHFDGVHVHRQEFRRRSVPPYEIFDLPLPSSETALKFRMVDGIIMCVRITSQEERLAQQSSSDSLLGLYVASEDGDVEPISSLQDAHDDIFYSENSLFPVLSYNDFYNDFSQVVLRNFPISCC